MCMACKTSFQSVHFILLPGYTHIIPASPNVEPVRIFFFLLFHWKFLQHLWEWDGADLWADVSDAYWLPQWLLNVLVTSHFHDT